MFLINEALADSGAVSAATTAASGPNIFAQLLPLILIFVVFYFLLIRPQQKKIRQHLDMVKALRRGDRVVTGGGIIGTIYRVVDDKEVIVEIAENNRVRVVRSTIADVLAKGSGEGNDDEGERPNLKAVGK